MWESCVGKVSGFEILLGEGGDVELGARTSKHISMFVIDLLSLNSLLFTLHCFILFISYMLGLFVCLTCVKPRELYIAPQLLFRGI